MARNRGSAFAFSGLRPAQWARIVLLGALGLAGAWLAITLTLSGIARVKQPEIALRFMPGEAVALAGRADQLFFAKPADPPAAVATYARAALRAQAINPKALRVLGYYADSRGDSAEAGRLVRMAEKLSRREAGAQLWLIEAAARDGDDRRALYHYDIALRTRPETQTILFPRLANAIADGDIRAALRPYIRGPASWADDFLMIANASGPNLPAIVDLIAETGGHPDKSIAHDHALDLLTRLVAARDFANARRLYLLMPGAAPGRLTSTAFAAADRAGRFGPVGWRMLDDPDAGGGFTGAGDDGPVSLSVFVNAATTRPVASKLLYLAPGNYRFSARLTSLDRGDGGFLRWRLRCAADASDRSFWEIDSIALATRAPLVVPAGCAVQYLDLFLSGGKGQTGLEATIAEIAIAPAGGARKQASR